MKPGSVENVIFSGLDWLPTGRCPREPDITEQLLKGVKLGDRTYKNHLDGYNQLALLEGKGPFVRHELSYFAGPMLGSIRLDDFDPVPPAALRLAGRRGRYRHAIDH